VQLDPRQLQALSEVLDHKSFSAAARSLNLSLAAISLRIKALEEAVGQRLVTRGKSLGPTAAGRLVLAHQRQLELLNNDLKDRLQPASRGQSQLAVAINADSVASWFLAGLQKELQTKELLLDIHIDDQDHTHGLLKEGAVVGCVTTQAKAIAGCIARPLGAMRYRCVAAPGVKGQLRNGKRSVQIHDLLKYPAVCFNRKDRLQDLFLANHFGLKDIQYARHYIPSVDGFHEALVKGIGWGMEATIQTPEAFRTKRLVELFPGKTVDVPLYWQHAARQTQASQRLTAAIVSAASKNLYGAV
jgi:LysR family transcriptional regulator, chromosome initiation inhibitor